MLGIDANSDGLSNCGFAERTQTVHFRALIGAGHAWRFPVLPNDS